VNQKPRNSESWNGGRWPHAAGTRIGCLPEIFRTLSEPEKPHRWRAANGSIWQMLYTTSTTKSLPLGTTQVAHGLIWRDRAGSNGTDWDGEWENKTHCAVRKLPSRPVKTLIKPRGSPRFRPPSHFIPFDPTLSRFLSSLPAARHVDVMGQMVCPGGIELDRTGQTGMESEETQTMCTVRKVVFKTY
jgi:hypothetical protein